MSKPEFWRLKVEDTSLNLSARFKIFIRHLVQSKVLADWTGRASRLKYIFNFHISEVMATIVVFRLQLINYLVLTPTTFALFTHKLNKNSSPKQLTHLNSSVSVERSCSMWSMTWTISDTMIGHREVTWCGDMRSNSTRKHRKTCDWTPGTTCGSLRLSASLSEMECEC